MHRCPEPVGPGEIEYVFGVSRERVAQLRREPDFPQPWKHLRTGVVYRDTDIEEYVRLKKRKNVKPWEA